MNPIQDAWEARKRTSKSNDTAVNLRCRGRPVFASALPKRISRIGKDHVGNKSHG
jgi:hypothetical protein